MKSSPRAGSAPHGVTEPTSVAGPTALPEVPAARERVLEAIASQATAAPSRRASRAGSGAESGAGPGAESSVGPARGSATQRPGAATIGDLVDVLGGHPNTTRAHLVRLIDDGLVSRTTLEAGTRGRPAYGYHLTDRGRLVLEALRVARPVTTDELITAMAEHLETTADPDVHARAIGRRWAAQLSESLADRPSGGRTRRAKGSVETVVDLL
ncbi:MAG TPA: hypothetical protein VFN43_01720, partial [Humibacillus sp.]|nr:hypothetical protein [Humibacillus sp.]